jgi:phosphoenolpyruvate-protein kinase (PTS system EI component)
MAFKIKATEIARVEQEITAIYDERTKVEDAVLVFNTALAAARATLQESIDAYNEAAEALRGHIADVHRELEDEYDERSEKWQEGEKGEAAKAWLDTLEQFPESVSDLSLDFFPEALEVEELLDGEDVQDAWNELDKEPGE